MSVEVVTRRSLGELGRLLLVADLFAALALFLFALFLLALFLFALVVGLVASLFVLVLGGLLGDAGLRRDLAARRLRALGGIVVSAGLGLVLLGLRGALLLGGGVGLALGGPGGALLLGEAAPLAALLDLLLTGLGVDPARLEVGEGPLDPLAEAAGLALVGELGLGARGLDREAELIAARLQRL